MISKQIEYHTFSVHTAVFILVVFLHDGNHSERYSVQEREREIEREILKFGVSLWQTDKHSVLLTARERERERESRRERERFKSFIYCSSAWTSSVFD